MSCISGGRDASKDSLLLIAGCGFLSGYLGWERNGEIQGDQRRRLRGCQKKVEAFFRIYIKASLPSLPSPK